MNPLKETAAASSPGCGPRDRSLALGSTHPMTIASGQNEEPMSEEEFASLMAKTTLNPCVDVCVSGQFDTREDADKLGKTVVLFLQMLGVYLQLDCLEALTVTDDYENALLKIERGFSTNKALAPTRDEFGTGYAMSIPVIRNGALKTHIVIHSGLIKPLVDPNHEKYSFAVHTLAHELGHAHDHSVTGRTLPNLVGTQLPDFRQGTLFNLAHGCWCEYIASRLSATWGTENYCAEFEPTLCDMLSTAMDRGTACIFCHRMHGNIADTEAEMKNIYGGLLTRLSYLVGHLHGIEASIKEKTPKLHTLIQDSKWFIPIFERYESNLKELKETHENWTGIEVFNPLMDTCESMLNAGGMRYLMLPTGNYFVELKYPNN